MKKLVLALVLIAVTSAANAAEYAAVQSGVILERRDFASAPPDMTRKGFTWLPVIRTDPDYDATTQVKTGPVTAINATDVTDVWTVRPKTTQELDADKAAAIAGITVAIIRALCNHENRLRDLQRFARADNNAQAVTAGIPTPANSATLTIDECKTLLQSLIP